jgi:hypothetical protein
MRLEVTMKMEVLLIRFFFNTAYVNPKAGI